MERAACSGLLSRYMSLQCKSLAGLSRQSPPAGGCCVACVSPYLRLDSRRQFYQWRGILTFVALSLVVGNFFENLGESAHQPIQVVSVIAV
jgi:hypothetical protein